jgi:hypothetical protein
VNTQYPLLTVARFSSLFVCADGLCRSVVMPHRDLGAHASPSRTRWSDQGAAAHTLVDDARTTTPLPAVDSRMATPPPAFDAWVMASPLGADASAQGSIGDVGRSTSSPVINVSPISVMPGGADVDLVRDQAQIDLAEGPIRRPERGGVNGSR